MKKTSIIALLLASFLLTLVVSCKKDKTNNKFTGTYQGSMNRKIDYHTSSSTNKDTTYMTTIVIRANEAMSDYIYIDNLITSSMAATVNGNNITIIPSSSNTGKDSGYGNISGSSLSITYEDDVVSCVSSTGYSEVTFNFKGTKN